MPRPSTDRSRRSYHRVVLAVSMLCEDHTPYTEATDAEIAAHLAALGRGMSPATVRRYIRAMEAAEEIAVFRVPWRRTRRRQIVFLGTEETMLYLGLFARDYESVLTSSSPRVRALVEKCVLEGY